jgi:hypothetical protein
VESCEFASAVIASEGLPAIHQVNTEEAPEAKRAASSFEQAESTKVVPIDPSSSEGKMVRIGTDLSPK